MVMRDIGSFHYPETRFIFRGAAEGNKQRQGVMETAYIPHNHTLTVLLYRYNILISVHLHLLSFLLPCEYLMHNVTLLCQDYAMVRRLSFCRNQVKTLSIMARGEIHIHYIMLHIGILC